MKISKDKWVAIHYTLTDEDGNIIDSSVGGEPLGYVHGNGYLIPGLERELESKTVGDKFIAVIKPEDGYGEFDPNLIIDVDRSQFDFAGELQLGMQFQVGTPKGLSIVKIKEINGDKIKIDGNHELAGKTLHFDIEVVEVRDATEDELLPKGCSCGDGCSGGCGSGDCSCTNCGES